MDRTDGDGTEAPATPPPGGGATPRARARLYLDLWERHVVHLALHTPAPAPPPAPAPAGGTRRRPA